MEEKVLVKGLCYNTKKLEAIVLIVTIFLGIIVNLFLYISDFKHNYRWYTEDYDICCKHGDSIQVEETDDFFGHVFHYNGEEYHNRNSAEKAAAKANHSTASSYALCATSFFDYTPIIAGILIFILILNKIICIGISKISLTVTEKRIYGNVMFGKQVDLPVDSISAISSSAMKGIAVATSSGKIVFKFIENRDDVHNVIIKLIRERQNSKQAQESIQTPLPPIVSATSADELKKFKELLDMGAITEEEFNEKKKQLLGL